MPTIQARPRLDSLASLRYLAASYIFLFHCFAMKGLEQVGAPHWFQQFASLGYIGVDFFFVLSGFVLVYGYGERDLKLGRFLRARLARLYPAYAFSLLLVAPFFFWGVHHLDIAWFAWSKAHEPLMIFLNVTLLQAWVPQAALTWNSVAWALSVIVFFYLLFPSVARRFRQWNSSRTFAIAGVLWLCTLSIASAYMIFQPDGVRYPNPFHVELNWLNALKFNPLMHVPEFLLGMALGFVALRSRISPERGTAYIGAGSALLLTLILASPWIPYPIIHTGLTAPAFLLMIYGFAARPAWTSVFESRLPVMLGDASFSFYLLHSTILGMTLFARPGAPATVTKIVVAYIISALVSLAVYRWIEKPARRWIDPPARKKAVETSAPLQAIAG